MVDDKPSAKESEREMRRRKPCTIACGRKYVHSYPNALASVDHLDTDEEGKKTRMVQSNTN
jgi:hypothetical protein